MHIIQNNRSVCIATNQVKYLLIMKQWLRTKSHCLLYEITDKCIWISNFRCVLNVVCFLLGNTPASEFYMPTFRNTLSHLHRRIDMKDD